MRRIYLIRGTTQIGLHPLTRILTYTPPGNGCGFRQFLLSVPFCSPASILDLPSKVHSAIPSILQSHHLQLSVISAKCLLLFLIGLSLLLLIIMRQNGFVNHFFQTINYLKMSTLNSTFFHVFIVLPFCTIRSLFYCIFSLLGSAIVRLPLLPASHAPYFRSYASCFTSSSNSSPAE